MKKRNSLAEKTARNILGYLICILALTLGLCACRGEKEEVLLLGSGDSLTVTERADDAARDEESGESGRRTDMIYVHVCGAVKTPGVVELPEGSRAEDALLAAGGFAEGAAREYVNLAAKVKDGERLYFPTEEELLQNGGKTHAEAASEAGTGLVNINTADVKALCTLSGIGESRAADIIKYREKHGDFKKCEDLMKVPGIKTKLYEGIRDSITVQ